jgi:hypothetical protein
MRTLVAVMLVVLLVACGRPDRYDPREYKGDGTLEADRLSDAFDWVIYTLDLGVVDLSRPAVREFSMGSLPPASFSPVLVASGKAGAPVVKDGVWFDPSIRLRFRDAGGKVVCQTAGHLRTWHVSLPTTNPAPDTKAPLMVVRAPLSRYFTPEKRRRYNLEIEVTEGDPRARDYSVKLLLESSSGK